MSRPPKPPAGPAPAKKAARALERATGAKRTTPKPKGVAAKPKGAPAKQSAVKTPAAVSTVDATRAELEALKVDAAVSALAAAALALAQDIDGVATTAAERASCSRALLVVMTRVRALAPPQKTGDVVDRVGQRHARRRARLRAVK